VESSISEIRAPGLTEVSTLTSRVAKSRRNLSHPLERGHVSRDHPYRGFRHRRSEKEVLQLREWRSREEIRTVHLRRTGGSNRGVGEVSKKSECRLRELGGSQGESPRVGCSKSRVAKS
jgi:hypothetical protein